MTCETQETIPLISEPVTRGRPMEPPKNSPRVRVPVTVMTVLFGAGSWIAINGLWVELPLLVALKIPENYNLASYLTVIIQLANIGPLIFFITNYFFGKNRHLEIPAVFIIVTLGCFASFLLIFFWDSYTVWGVDGSLHSTALLVLAFFLSVVDCTSSVTFTPFMSLLKNSYLTWYFIGEGLSSLLPSVVALAQGVGSVECVANGTYINHTQINNVTVEQNCTDWISRDSAAHFPPQDFFGFLFALMLTCGISFALLNYLPIAKCEHISAQPGSTSPSTVSSTESSESHTLVTHSDKEGRLTNTSTDKGIQGTIPVAQEDPDSSDGGLKDAQGYIILGKLQYIYLLAILCFVCSLSNGVLPSIQSFSCGAYGLNTYLLASTLAKIANPAAATLVMLRPSTNLALVGVMTVLGTVFGAYCMLTAVLSPTPPLQDEFVGRALIVLSWILLDGFFVYTKATIAWILRTQPESHNLLVWYGAITQVGSLIGSFIMWPIINVAHAFHPYYGDPCEGFQKCVLDEIPAVTSMPPTQGLH